MDAKKRLEFITLRKMLNLNHGGGGKSIPDLNLSMHRAETEGQLISASEILGIDPDLRSA